MKIATLAIVGTMAAMTATESFAIDPGINQPGMMGNHGVGRSAARDPGVNQPGAVGNAPAALRRRACRGCSTRAGRPRWQLLGWGVIRG